MEFLNWGFLDLVWFENTARRWILAALVSVFLIVVLRYIRKKVSRKLRALAERTENRFDDVLAEMLSRTRLIVLLIVSVWAGSQVLTLPGQVQFVIRNAAIIAILLQLAIWGNTLIRYAVMTYVRLEEGDDASHAATSTALIFIGRLVLWSLVLLVGLQNVGVEVTALLASLGVGGIAVALASQNILGDLFASLSIYFDRPFVVGDFIVVGDLLGTVERIGLKTTRVRSLPGEELVFSNADLLSSRIRNFKTMRERRIVFSIGILYETPYEKLVRVPELIREIIEREELVRFDRAHFRAYGDSSLDFEIVYWVEMPDYNAYMDIQQRINLELFRRFGEEGIGFAYPTRTLYLPKAVAETAGAMSHEISEQ